MKKTSSKKTTSTTTARKKVASDTPDLRVVGSSTAKSSAPYGVAPYKIEKDEDYMNDEQLAHFLQILRNWRAELMDEVDRTVSHMKGGSGHLPDPNDRASQEEGFALELRTRDRERKLIKKIEEAIEQIEEKDYGYCEECGVEIGVRRLEARPTATLCIDCKTLAEIKEKQLTGG